MCDVCVAERALWTTRCKDKQCMAFHDGDLIEWSDAPKVKGAMTPRGKEHLKTVKRMKRRPGKYSIIHAILPAPGIRIRATGGGAEFKRCKVQLKLDWEAWPKKWEKTIDLAGFVCHYGLDTKWKFVPKPVQNWVLGKRGKPSVQELIRLLPKGDDVKPVFLNPEKGGQLRKFKRAMAVRL